VVVVDGASVVVVVDDVVLEDVEVVTCSGAVVVEANSVVGVVKIGPAVPEHDDATRARTMRQTRVR
jgi:hypothetical protein